MSGLLRRQPLYDQLVDILSEKVKEATRLIKLCKEKLYKVDEEVKKVLEELD